MISAPYSRSHYFINFVLPNLLISKFNYGIKIKRLPKIKSLNLRIFFRKYKNDINIYLRTFIIYYLSLIAGKTAKLEIDKNKFIKLNIKKINPELYYTLDYIIYIGTAQMKSLGEKYKVKFTKNVNISLKNFPIFLNKFIYNENYSVSYNFINYSFLLTFCYKKYTRVTKHFTYLTNV